MQLNIYMLHLVMLEVKTKVLWNTMGTQIQYQSGLCLAMVLGTKKSQSAIVCGLMIVKVTSLISLIRFLSKLMSNMPGEEEIGHQKVFLQLLTGVLVQLLEIDFSSLSIY